jgi:hypothetical protein
MKGKKPEIVQKLVNSAILDPMPGTSKTRELDTMAMIKRNKLRDPEELTGCYEIRPIITSIDLKGVKKPPFPEIESRSTTTDLIKTTPESIRKSWGIGQDSVPSEYMAGLERLYAIPGTIEDEIPPVSEAFARKVHESGGMLTMMGILCNPEFPVTGKRYWRIANAFFRTLHSDRMRTVADAEFFIRSHLQRDKSKPDWEGMYTYFSKCISLAFKMRHRPYRRAAVRANQEVVINKDALILLEKPDFPIESPFKKD